MAIILEHSYIYNLKKYVNILKYDTSDTHTRNRYIKQIQVIFHKQISIEFKLLRQILALSFGRHQHFRDYIKEIIIMKLVNNPYRASASHIYVSLCFCGLKYIHVR